MADSGARYSQRFKQLLREYPKDDGDQWRGVEIERATNGFVTGSYVTAMKKGRITRPGLDKLRAIAEVMGFPFEAWLGSDEPRRSMSDRPDAGEDSFADLVNYLFDAIRDGQTGEPYSNRQVAEMSRGRLSEPAIEQMRTGDNPNPSRSELLALCDVFDVEFSYWDLRKERPPLMNADTIRGLRDASSYAILHKSLELPSDDKDLIMTMMEELERRHSRKGPDTST